jgi:N-acetylneuraminic acid mutarotase
MWSFNPHSSQWTEIPVNGNWPSSRYLHGLTGAGSRLYLFGGYSGVGGYSGGHLNDLWAFSTATSTWAQLAAGALGPSARRVAGLASSGGLVYVLGGYGPSESLRDLWSYDPAQDGWSDRTSSVEGGGTWPRAGVGGAGGLLDVAGELFSVNMRSGAGIAPAISVLNFNL